LRALPASANRLSIRAADGACRPSFSAKERLMKSISDSGKVKIGGGGGIKLIKPVKKTKLQPMTRREKVKIGGAEVTLVKPTKKAKK
jgi:hypothetical protein